MKIKDIRVDDNIHVFNYGNLGLDIYKVLNIFVSKDNQHIFECKPASYNEHKELSYDDFSIYVHESDVMGKFDLVIN